MQKYQEALDAMSKTGTEYVRGIPVVKVFQQTVYSFTAFKKTIDAYSDYATEFTTKGCRLPQSLNLTFTEGVFTLFVPVAFFLAPGAMAKGNLASFVVDFAFYAIFSAVISTALAKIMFMTNGLMTAKEALNRIQDIMNVPEVEVSKSQKKPNNNEIVFDHVTFTYEGANHPALSDVSFRVPAGSTIALVGPSGGGKTTAASLIPRFMDVEKGSVQIGGVNVKDMDVHKLMDQVAFVFQSGKLFKMSILENVKASKPDASRQQVLDALEAAQCKDILEKFPEGADTVIGSKGIHLSGGETQRILLARAILKDAPIVVLDEATAFADPENEVLIQKAFENLAKDKTVLMVAHRLSTVTNADCIVVLDKGKVVESGRHEELRMKGGLYAHMWDDYKKGLSWKIENSDTKGKQTKSMEREAS
ncbi:ABC transporter [Lachnospiraceae bacterium XBB1006]|nr:ABC transporter [Lachnospiraceae bacterium XBB1006]